MTALHFTYNGLIKTRLKGVLFPGRSPSVTYNITEGDEESDGIYIKGDLGEIVTFYGKTWGNGNPYVAGNVNNVNIFGTFVS